MHSGPKRTSSVDRTTTRPAGTTFSVSLVNDALAAPNATVAWTGVRNYQARNFMRDAMRIGDGVLFYHSSCAEPGIVGIARVASTAYPDPTQFDRTSPYHDRSGAREGPT